MVKDYRIICFVRNEKQNNNLEGLFHVFGDQFHDTDVPFISNFIYYRDENNQKQIRFSNNFETKFLLISKDTSPQLKTIITSDDTWDILLVSQDIRFSDFPPNFFTDDMLVMYHGSNDGNRNDVQNNIKDKVRKIKPGHHEPNDSDGYHLLLNVAIAWDNNKGTFKQTEYEQAKEKLINWFGLNAKLNAALEFLHQSLGNNNADKGILTHPDCFSSDELSTEEADAESKTITSIDKLINTLQGYQPTNTEYYPTLTRVRDRLLAKSGVG